MGTLRYCTTTPLPGALVRNPATPSGPLVGCHPPNIHPYGIHSQGPATPSRPSSQPVLSGRHPSTSQSLDDAERTLPWPPNTPVQLLPFEVLRFTVHFQLTLFHELTVGVGVVPARPPGCLLPAFIELISRPTHDPSLSEVSLYASTALPKISGRIHVDPTDSDRSHTLPQGPHHGGEPYPDSGDDPSMCAPRPRHRERHPRPPRMVWTQSICDRQLRTNCTAWRSSEVNSNSKSSAFGRQGLAFVPVLFSMALANHRRASLRMLHFWGSDSCQTSPYGCEHLLAADEAGTMSTSGA